MTDIFQALASPVRRDILGLLKTQDMTAGELADHLAVSKPTLSGHFNILKAADLILARKQGTTITYSLNISVAEGVLTSLYSLFGVKTQHDRDDEDKGDAL